MNLRYWSALQLSHVTMHKSFPDDCWRCLLRRPVQPNQDPVDHSLALMYTMAMCKKTGSASEHTKSPVMHHGPVSSCTYATNKHFEFKTRSIGGYRLSLLKPQGCDSNCVCGHGLLVLCGPIHATRHVGVAGIRCL